MNESLKGIEKEQKIILVTRPIAKIWTLTIFG